jgi:hypothetical protein
MKKRIISFMVLAVMALTLCSCSSYAPNEVVYVYNWGEYIDESVNDMFTAETGIEVVYRTYDNNESMYATLKNKGANYDVVIPSDYMISRMIEEDMLEPINFDNIPNFQYIMDSFKNLEYDPQNLYSVPYTWGIVGLLYNKDYVTQKPTSWRVLWDEQYKGKTLMYNNVRDTLAIGLLINGYSLNTTNEEELRKAADDIIAQKSNLQAYVSDEIFNLMENNSAYLAVAYAGDIVSMMEENPSLDFAIPDEGTNRFVDAMCIVKGSQNKEAAEKYINFMCRQDIAELNRVATNYSSPQQQVVDALDESIKSNEILYPSDEVLERCEVFTGLPDETMELYNELWKEIKG